MKRKYSETSMLKVRNMYDNSRKSCQTCERKSFQINPIWCKFYLHSLQGQLDWVYFFIFDLKSCRDTDCHIFCDNKLQIFGLKWDRISIDPLEF